MEVLSQVTKRPFTILSGIPAVRRLNFDNNFACKTYPKRIKYIEFGDKCNGFRSKHLRVSHECWIDVMFDVTFLVVRLYNWCLGNILCEGQAGTVVSLCLDVRQDGHKVQGLLAWHVETPSRWLAELQTQTKVKVGMECIHRPQKRNYLHSHLHLHAWCDSYYDTI